VRPEHRVPCVTPHHPVVGVIGASVLGCVMGDIEIDDILIDEHPLFPHNPIQPLCNHCVVATHVHAEAYRYACDIHSRSSPGAADEK
jgi:hypothetical protein